MGRTIHARVHFSFLLLLIQPLYIFSSLLCPPSFPLSVLDLHHFSPSLCADLSLSLCVCVSLPPSTAEAAEADNSTLTLQPTLPNKSVDFSLNQIMAGIGPAAGGGNLLLREAVSPIPGLIEIGSLYGEEREQEVMEFWAIATNGSFIYRMVPICGCGKSKQDRQKREEMMKGEKLLVSEWILFCHHIWGHSSTRNITSPQHDVAVVSAAVASWQHIYMLWHQFVPCDAFFFNPRFY